MPNECFTAYDWEIHHDWIGWYLVAPEELRDEGGFGPNGLSLGFDGRPHWGTEADARAFIKVAIAEQDARDLEESK